jgi:hypothetical protein
MKQGSRFFPWKAGTDDRRRLVLRISCTEADWQLSSVAQVCQWLELFRTLTTVRTLCLSEEVGLRVASALQDIAGETVTQVLLALQVLLMRRLLPRGPTREALDSFASARQRFGRPIGVRRWGK